VDPWWNSTNNNSNPTAAHAVEQGVLWEYRTTNPNKQPDHQLQGPMTMMDNTPPASNLMSNCSWGGWWVE
jgi:hypothetical protein